MVELERKIFVSDYLNEHEYEYTFGDKRNESVVFIYYNLKREREGRHITKTFREALMLAHARARDGRYKNYEFYIERESEA